MSMYRKRPAVVEARQYALDLIAADVEALVEWIGTNGGEAQWTNYRPGDPDCVNAHGHRVWRYCPTCDFAEPDHEYIAISTLEGVMEARPGDWIIRGVQGEFYPCKPDIFATTYDEVVDLIEPTPAHHPVGAYLPVGQMDGDCSCGSGPWPCPAAREEARS